MIDYSCTEDGNNHRLVIISGNTTYQIDYSGQFQEFFDHYRKIFELSPDWYIPEDCRGQSSKFSDFLNLRLQ